jgi:Ca-activated chloride channel family protein
LPLVAALYVWVLRRRRRFTLRYSSTNLVRAAAGETSGLRRHGPAALYLLTIMVLVLAAARPQATLSTPEATGTVILAIDVSGSMRGNDVLPSRIDAAKAAIRAFVNKEPRGVKIGVVAFSQGAVLVTPPTNDRKQVLSSVNILQLTRGTNIGDGLRVAFETLAYPDGDDPNAPTAPPQTAPGFQAVAGVTGTIVLLSDGAATTGPDPIQIARQIAATGIKTYTVGLGTTQGSFQGQGGNMRLDEATLKGIATITGGEYFSAQNAGQLHQIYGKLARESQFGQEATDVTFLLGGGAMLLLLAGLGLGAAWSSRLP